MIELNSSSKESTPDDLEAIDDKIGNVGAEADVAMLRATDMLLSQMSLPEEEEDAGVIAEWG